MYAHVFVGYPVDESFTYRVPEGLQVEPGTRVRVDFGGRQTTAFVHGLSETFSGDFVVKDLIEAIDETPIFDERLVDLARYVAESYGSSVGEALAMALPSGKSSTSRFRVPWERPAVKEISLTGEQEGVYRDILASQDTGQLQHLIFGITGSGKTEIYIELAKRTLERNLSVLYLVPEITLSSQIFERIYGIFGDDMIIYHSHLTPNQRLHNWLRFYRGEAKVTVGTRSSIFLQPPGLGLIIIDEEHDTSYKEQSSPRYNARRVAFHRSRTEKALLVMGSATPAVESLYAAERGNIRLHRLVNRYGGATLPEIEIVKMNPQDMKTLLTPRLLLHTRRTVDRGKQSIFLLNRRGFAPLVMCDSCKWVAECPHCSISLNFHREGMICHYCGFRRPLPDVCDNCGADEIIKLGSGTQRVEDYVAEAVKGARIFRLDQDSSRKKETVYSLMDRMNGGEIDVLLGTQLVAKGFDFRDVVLVGILLADIGINLPDFRAGERIMALLMQVAGRSGRGSEPGRVLIQALNHDHTLFRFLINHDYEGFYRSELDVRRAMGYPPFTRLVRLLLRGKNGEKVAAEISRVGGELSALIKKRGDILMLGPSEAPFSRIGGNYRHHIILKFHRLEDVNQVIKWVKQLQFHRDLYLEIDVDPVDLL